MNTKAGRTIRRSRLDAEKFLSHVLHTRGGMRGSSSRRHKRFKRSKTKNAEELTKFDAGQFWFLEKDKEEERPGSGSKVMTHDFVRLPSRVLEPLLKWKRVLVNSMDGTVTPMDSRSSLAEYIACHNSRNSAEKVIKKDSVGASSHGDYVEETAEALSNRWQTEKTPMAVTRGKCLSSVEQYHNDTISKGSAVYAVYFGTYYPALVQSVNGIFGYEVRFLSDNVVKSVPPEAVLTLNSLQVGHKCMIKDSSDGITWMEAMIAALPHNVETDLITVSILNMKGKLIRTSSVRWHDLSFPIRLWRKEINRRTQLKVNVAMDFTPCDENPSNEREFEANNSGTASHSQNRSSEPNTSSGAAIPRQDEDVYFNYAEADMSRSTRGSKKHRTNAIQKVSIDMIKALRCRDPTLFSPLWANFRSADEVHPTTAHRSKWLLALRVSSFLKVRPATSLRGRSFLVTLEGRRWHCQYRLLSSQLSSQKEADAFEERERMVETMRSIMERRCPEAFCQQYPHNNRRLDFQKEWRVALRIAETSINRRLRSFGMAPIYIESWTRNQPAPLNFDYLPRSTISIQQRRELIAEGARLRYMYPEFTSGCKCERQKCVVGICPCLVYKKNNSVMMCGQACGCDDSCPSSYLRQERQVPLVLFNTKRKGWGVVAPVKIPAGTFLGLYAGHMVKIDDQTLYDNTYVFDINEQVDGEAQRYAIDGTWSGNISRFFNHTCVNPTVEAKVLFTRGNMVTHDLAFFTTRDIEIGEELVFCYSKDVMQQKSFGIPCRIVIETD